MPGVVRSASVSVVALICVITSCGMTVTDLGVSSSGAVCFEDEDCSTL